MREKLETVACALIIAAGIIYVIHFAFSLVLTDRASVEGRRVR